MGGRARRGRIGVEQHDDAATLGHEQAIAGKQVHADETGGLHSHESRIACAKVRRRSGLARGQNGKAVRADSVGADAHALEGDPFARTCPEHAVNAERPAGGVRRAERGGKTVLEQGGTGRARVEDEMADLPISEMNGQRHQPARRAPEKETVRLARAVEAADVGRRECRAGRQHNKGERRQKGSKSCTPKGPTL